MMCLSPSSLGQGDDYHQHALFQDETDEPDQRSLQEKFLCVFLQLFRIEAHSNLCLAKVNKEFGGIMTMMERMIQI